MVHVARFSRSIVPLLRLSRPVVRRHLPVLLTVGLMLLAATTGLSAQQTAVESAAFKLLGIFVRMTPWLSTIAFIAVGIMVAVGVHDSYERLFKVCFGVAIAMGALGLVQYFT